MRLFVLGCVLAALAGCGEDAAPVREDFTLRLELLYSRVSHPALEVYRHTVPSGWVYVYYGGAGSISSMFVPDPPEER